MRSCAALVALHAQKHPFTCSREECSRGSLRACIEKGDALFSWDLQIFQNLCQKRFAWLLVLARASDLSQLEGDRGQKQKCLYRTVQHGAASTAIRSHCASEAAQCDVCESATGFAYFLSCTRVQALSRRDCCNLEHDAELIHECCRDELGHGC